ncbi:dienelactone hydrolase [Thioalkalivibrio sulfidiphilus HL-EbGr7]|uniref:Dienelactone hydrolase n=1 Tax=Thioalkalivibrio sulfidiphilus (strain HL-EbGR7) TaxID=396588 RepID=B8GM01_THISH|nr:dienelactone hydrolase family protein [Thioalkalivibrio sulfidiphilus]ACL71754.1 dienelactone hydrolase [Thioalkalivibrio sulfidiphilus HL-EbGr7]
MSRLLVLLFLALSMGLAHGADVRGEEVTYTDNGTTLKGYLAYDASASGPRPGVLVIHEWWGHNEHARNQARRLAELGYTALAVDMYGDGQVADHPQDAGKFAGAIRQNRELMMKRFTAAENFLRSQTQADAEKVAAIGYCFGGSVVLEMARSGADLLGVASFHGALATQNPAQSGEVKSRVLVLHGNEDPMVPAEQVEGFKKEMDAAGVSYHFVGYDGATHSFTNPAADEAAKKFGMPVGYNAEADQKSWGELERFLAETFGN